MSQFSSPKVGAPLAGVLVADFSRVLAGPLATMTLADLGAKVIKVERPGTGDPTRLWGPPYSEDGTSTYYLAVNRNKFSLELDLSTSSGQEHARALAARADVLIENFRSGTMDRLGLGYADLHPANPRLIYCRISGFGETDRARELPGYDLLAQAASGLMSLTGERDRAPMKTGVAIADVLTGLYATVGILAALQRRQRDGVGDHIEVSLLGSALASLVNQASSYLHAGDEPHRAGNRHPSIVPYEIFPTATRPIAVAVGTDEQFSRLCRAIGLATMASDTRFSSNDNRVRNRSELTRELAEIFGTRSAANWLATLRMADVPSGPVNTVGEAFEYAKNLGLNPIVDCGGTATVASPIQFLQSEVTYDLAPPDLGAHTDEILSWLRSG